MTGNEFSLAERDISATNSHYRIPLTLSRALVEGSIADPFASGPSEQSSFVFDLAYLFERFTERLLRMAIAQHGYDLTRQYTGSASLVDAHGQRYRRVVPDLLIRSGGTIRAVIDCKFKPNYLVGNSDETIDQGNRVKNSDIYQIFFYQAAIEVKNRGIRPSAALVAPQLHDGPLPDAFARTVVWRQTSEHDSYQFTVIALPLHAILEQIQLGASEEEVVSAAGELVEFVGQI